MAYARPSARPLHEPLGLGIDGRAPVDQELRASLPEHRHRHRDRGPVHAPDAAHAQAARRPSSRRCCPRRPSPAARPSRTASAQRTSDESFLVRTALAGSSSIAMTSSAGEHRDPGRRTAAGRCGGEHVGRADEQDLDVELGRRRARARDDLRGRAVAAHRVDRDHGPRPAPAGRRQCRSPVATRRRAPAGPGTNRSCRTPCAGSRDAPQFGHSECGGRLSCMFADLRDRVAERLILRFGTAIRSAPGSECQRSSDRRAAQRGSDVVDCAVARVGRCGRRRSSGQIPAQSSRHSGAAAVRAGARRGRAGSRSRTSSSSGRSRRRAALGLEQLVDVHGDLARDGLEAPAAGGAPRSVRSCRGRRCRRRCARACRRSGPVRRPGRVAAPLSSPSSRALERRRSRTAPGAGAGRRSGCAGALEADWRLDMVGLTGCGAVDARSAVRLVTRAERRGETRLRGAWMRRILPGQRRRPDGSPAGWRRLGSELVLVEEAAGSSSSASASSGLGRGCAPGAAPGPSAPAASCGRARPRTRPACGRRSPRPRAASARPAGRPCSTIVFGGPARLAHDLGASRPSARPAPGRPR